MRPWIVGVLVFAVASQVTVAASACKLRRPVDDVRPVATQTSSQAAVLLAQARSLESEASEHTRAAVMFARRAELLEGRARVIRRQAVLVAFTDRGDLLDVADELADRAASERAQARFERTRASDLRARARSLRDRAAALSRGQNKRWWRRHVPAPRPHITPKRAPKKAPTKTPVPAGQQII